MKQFNKSSGWPDRFSLNKVELKFIGDKGSVVELKMRQSESFLLMGKRLIVSFFVDLFALFLFIYPRIIEVKK